MPETADTAASKRAKADTMLGLTTPGPKEKKEAEKKKEEESLSPNDSFAKTRLGLPPPASSSSTDLTRSGVYAMEDPSAVESQARRTRPGWIIAALAGKDGEDAQARRAIKLVPGQQVPGTRYKITRWIGDGGMGVVYEARHLDLDRPVALKVLRAEACRNPEAIRMFRDEARAASRIGSDYITQIFDFAELSDGRLLFAMELLRGRSVAQELAAGPMEPSRVIAILRQVCKGLHAAHKAGIIHRDVKPDNILLRDQTSRHDAVKLLDFGISTVIDESQKSAAGAAGTAYYVAPELVAGTPFDARVDMYALGCTAYEMLTGRPPFEADTIEQILVDHLEKEPTPIREAYPEGKVPRSLEKVVMRCLGKHPHERYEDMQDLEAALCEAQIDAKLQTTWDDLALPDVDPTRRVALLSKMPEAGVPIRTRSNWLWPAVAVIALLLVGALGYRVWVGPTATAEEQTQIATLVNESRAAAARAYFVYPPVEDPSAPTAYAKLRELEQIGASEARQAAKQLRGELVDTLVRLADTYWEKDGGKPFAIDYYAQALVFDPDQEIASQRARLTVGQLSALQDKAEAQSFTDDELIAAEPLAVLAETNPEELERKLVAMEERDGELATTVGAELEAVTGRKRRGKRKKKAQEEAVVAAAPDAAPAVEGEEGGAETGGEDAGEGEAGDGAGAPKRKQYDPHEADRLAQLGTKSLQAGSSKKAEEFFQDALANYPRNPEALIGLSQIYFDRAKYSQAAAYGRKAVNARPGNADFRIRLGDAYYKLYRYDDALKHYERAAELGHARAAKKVSKAKAKLGG